MKYQFQVSLTEDDYLAFNLFHALKSPYGAKNTMRIRILTDLILVLFVAILFIFDGVNVGTVMAAVAMLIYIIVVHLCYKRILTSTIKRTIKAQKKKGKVAFSPLATMEFFEDHFVESTEENRTEQKYTVVERISVVENRYVYLHTNNIMAYIIPMASFASQEEYDSFLTFAKENISENIDVYEKV